MIDIDDMARSILSKSIYKQSFCYFGLRFMPELFINTQSDYLVEILTRARKLINNDDKFGKIIYTYLCYPSYFSISDYNVMIDTFASIDYSLQIYISTKTFDGLFGNAVKNVIKHKHGVYNICNFMERLSFIYEHDNPWLNKLLLKIIFEHKDLISSSVLVNDFVLKMIDRVYGSIDNYMEMNIDNFVIEI